MYYKVSTKEYYHNFAVKRLVFVESQQTKFFLNLIESVY